PTRPLASSPATAPPATAPPTPGRVGRRSRWWWRSRAWFAPQASKRKPARRRASLELAGRLQQDADVDIPVFLLKQDVFFLHLALGDAPKLAHLDRKSTRLNS